MSSYQFGIFAEILAAIYYFFSGYKIIARRMRNYSGEIDLICSKKNQIIFIEVKARKFYEDKYDSWVISNNQKKRILRAADLFVANNNYYVNYDRRFDVMIFSFNKFPTIIKNVWF